MGDQLYDELLVELECPICTNYMSPPIRQCATGHNVCASCHQQLQNCALCQGKFYESRNLTLEALAVKMRYPCINKDAGCTARLSYMEKETHELQCNMEQCDWVGTSEKIGAEVLVEHDKDSAASSNVIPTNSKDTTGMRQCRVVYSYQQEQEDELNLNIGDIIDIIGVVEEGWWRGVLNGREGVFPPHFVEEITATTTISKSGSRESLSGVGDLNLGPSPALPSQPPEDLVEHDKDSAASSNVIPTNSNDTTGIRQCRVVYSYQQEQEDELNLNIGDIIDIIGVEEEGWWRGVLNGREGVFPPHFVEEITVTTTTTSKSGSRESLSGVGDLNLGPSPAHPSQPPQIVCQVTFPYEAQSDDELTLREGDLVTLLSKDGQEPGWWKGKLNGVVGIFPNHFVIVVPINVSTTSMATVAIEDRLKDEKKPRPPTDILYTTSATVILQNRKSLVSGQIGGTKPNLEPVKTTPPVPGTIPVIPIKKSPSSFDRSGGLFFGLKKKIVDVVDGSTSSKAVVSPPKVETNSNNNSKNAFDYVTRWPLLSDPRATRPKAPAFLKSRKMLLQ